MLPPLEGAQGHARIWLLLQLAGRACGSALPPVQYSTWHWLSLTFSACTSACPAETAAPPAAALPAAEAAQPSAPGHSPTPPTVTDGAGWQADQRGGGGSSSSEQAAVDGGAQGNEEAQVLQGHGGVT